MVTSPREGERKQKEAEVVVSRLVPGGNFWGLQCKECTTSGRVFITKSVYNEMKEHYRTAHVGLPITFERVRCHEETQNEKNRLKPNVEIPRRVMTSAGARGVTVVHNERELRELIEDSPVFLNLGRMAFAEKTRVQRLVKLPIAEQLRERAKRKLEVQNDVRCPICLVQFRETKAVVRHADSKHKVTLMTSTLRCFRCGLDYAMSEGSELYAHLLTQHDISLPSSESADMMHLFTTNTNPHEKINKCEHCSYRSVSESLMAEHPCSVRRSTQASQHGFPYV